MVFIVVEGVDNVGKTSFVEHYRKLYPLTIGIKLPSPEVYKLVETSPSSVWHALFHGNIEHTMRHIKKYIDEGFNVICDRYKYSHFVYESMTSKVFCEFKFNLNPDIIIYFRTNEPDKLPKNDTMEKEVDYDKCQKMFEKIFADEKLNVITIDALCPNSNSEAVTMLKKYYGKSLYIQ